MRSNIEEKLQKSKQKNRKKFRDFFLLQFFGFFSPLQFFSFKFFPEFCFFLFFPLILFFFFFQFSILFCEFEIFCKKCCSRLQCSNYLCILFLQAKTAWAAKQSQKPQRSKSAATDLKIEEQQHRKLLPTQHS